MIEHIYDRTDRGLDVNGKPFKKYTPGYTDSLAGQVGGKSRGGKVNLQLSGDMLAAMTLVKDKPGEVTIGWKDRTEREKAEGNIIGSYGQQSPNSKNARPFFGIKNNKLKELIRYIDGE